MTPESEKSLNQLRGQLEDSDEPKKFIRPKDGVKTYGLSRTTLNNVAKKAGALYRIDKCVLINVKILDEYIEKFRVTEEDADARTKH